MKTKPPNEKVGKRDEEYWEVRKKRRKARARGEHEFRERRKATAEYGRYANEFDD